FGDLVPLVEENTGLDSSLPFPPGFTPADQVKSDRKNSPLHSHSGGLNSRVLEESQPTKDQGSPKDNLNQRVGGSILEVIDDMIKVGQAMGFTMEGKFMGLQKESLLMISKYAPQSSASKRASKEITFRISLAVGMGIIWSWGISMNDYMQKAKIQWATEAMKSKFFHGILNRKRANLAIKGVMVDGDWVDDPCRVKEEFRLHFANRFRAPVDTSVRTIAGPKVSFELIRKSGYREWSLNISGIYQYSPLLSLLSGLSIKLKKSNLPGVGVMVGGICATSQAWMIHTGKLKARLLQRNSKPTRPKSVLHSMESLQGTSLMVLNVMYKENSRIRMDHDSRSRKKLEVGLKVRNYLSYKKYIEGRILSSLRIGRVWIEMGKGSFVSKTCRKSILMMFSSKAPIATRLIKYVPEKTFNVFAWKVHLNRIPTRATCNNVVFGFDPHSYCPQKMKT
ncbi:hypothetical protein Tco_0121545, partial [Tanacetum coccineum]